MIRQKASAIPENAISRICEEQKVPSRRVRYFYVGSKEEVDEDV